MTKTDHNVRLLLLLIAAGILVAIITTGCNPVARVIGNPKHYKAITEHVISSGACVNDSVYISDTTIILDTLYTIDYTSDTVRVGDSIYIDRVEYRTIDKIHKVKETITITDNSRIALLQKELIKKDGELIAKNDELIKSKAETKEARKERNKWRLYFWLVLAAITAFILRKPLLSVGRKLIGLPF